MPIRLTDPWSSTTTGASSPPAATGIGERRAETPQPHRRRAPIASPQGRVNSSRPRRGQRGEREPERSGEPRVDESASTIAAPRTGGQAERRDRLSARSPIAPMAAAAHDARLGAGQHDEPGERGKGEHRPQPPGHADEHARARAPADDGDVAAAHGREVGHAGGAHRVGEVREGCGWCRR